jgi:hypothetical protein
MIAHENDVVTVDWFVSMCRKLIIVGIIMKRVNTIHKYYFPIVLFIGLYGISACDHNSVQSDARDVPTTQDSTNFDFSQDAGWVHGNCLAIKHDLTPGTMLTLVFADPPQKTVRSKIITKAETGADCYMLSDDRKAINQAEDRKFYILDRPEAGADFIAIGIVSDSAKFSVKNHTLMSDLDEDGQYEAYSVCATSEGMKFYIWPEQAYQGEPLWTDYYYLGYDLTPTCPE